MIPACGCKRRCFWRNHPWEERAPQRMCKLLGDDVHVDADRDPLDVPADEDRVPLYDLHIRVDLYVHSSLVE